jgi:hypothetical protein
MTCSVIFDREHVVTELPEVPVANTTPTKLALMVIRALGDAQTILRNQGVDVTGEDVTEALAAVLATHLARNPKARLLRNRRELRDRFADRLKERLETAMLEVERAHAMPLIR